MRTATASARRREKVDVKDKLPAPRSRAATVVYRAAGSDTKSAEIAGRTWRQVQRESTKVAIRSITSGSTCPDVSYSAGVLRPAPDEQVIERSFCELGRREPSERFWAHAVG